MRLKAEAVARVEALPEKWRQKVAREKHECAMCGDQCADDLDEALKGGA